MNAQAACGTLAHYYLCPEAINIIDENQGRELGGPGDKHICVGRMIKEPLLSQCQTEQDGANALARLTYPASPRDGVRRCLVSEGV